MTTPPTLSLRQLPQIYNEDFNLLALKTSDKIISHGVSSSIIFAFAFVWLYAWRHASAHSGLKTFPSPIHSENSVSPV